VSKSEKSHLQIISIGLQRSFFVIATTKIVTALEVKSSRRLCANITSL
jgi:hypothetical protein